MAKGLSNRDLLNIVEAYLSDAEDFDSTELEKDRSSAIDFFEGKVDFPAEPGKSSVVSHDVSDTVNGIMPGLMRVFFASDKIVTYEPRKPGDEEGAEQATDCINYVFQNECDGYRVFHNAFHDGLLLRNGIVKHWWEDAPEYKTETLTGLSEDDMLMLADDDSVEEILEKREYLVGPDGVEIGGDKDDKGEYAGT